ncbi:MAG: DUF2283 domain-containing protein [Candidatus Omnitrophota bacterium]
MKISYDLEVDALYIQFRPIEPGQAKNRDLEKNIAADFGPDGLLSGIEVLEASRLIDPLNENFIVELAPIARKIA